MAANDRSHATRHLLKENTRPEVPEIGKTLCGAVIQTDGKVKGRLWKVCAMRSFALQNDLPAWTDLSGRSREFGNALRASAVMNLNDTIGKQSRPRTNMVSLAEMARRRWPDRRKKLIALRPSVVVCGRTLSLVRQQLTSDREAFDQGDGFLVWRGVPFIGASHPSSWRKKQAEDYEAFRIICARAIHKLGESWPSTPTAV